MNRDDAREFAKLMQAYAEGREIQLYTHELGWQDLKDPEFFARSPVSYRIKSEPREVWVKYDGIGRPVWVFASESEVAKDIRGPGFTYVLMREVMS